MKKTNGLELEEQEAFEIEELDDLALANATGGEKESNWFCPDFNFVADCGG